MAIANCKRCGRIFNKVGRDICRDCIQAEDSMLTEIRQFLRKHAMANIYEVAEGTNVPHGHIVDFIRDGRLILRDNPNMTYPCERCGKPTLSGRLCATCTSEMSKELKSAGLQLHDKNKGNERPGGGFYSRKS